MKIRFDGEEYTLIFTDHGKKRLEERNISLDTVQDSIENYDKKYKSYGKQVVEKYVKPDTIRTVFEKKPNHIILVTSIRLWK